MASIDDARRLIGLDHGLATVSTIRADGSIQSTVVNAGVVSHPVHGHDVAAFVARGATRKIEHLRRDARVALQWRAGWAWVTVEGTAELAGPDLPLPGLDADRVRLLLREIFLAAGGQHEDWAEYDRVMVAERRVAVLVTPSRVYRNA